MENATQKPLVISQWYLIIQWITDKYYLIFEILCDKSHKDIENTTQKPFFLHSCGLFGM